MIWYCSNIKITVTQFCHRDYTSSYFIYLYWLVIMLQWCISNNQARLSVCREVLNNIQSSQVFVMKTKLIKSCCLHFDFWIENNRFKVKLTVINLRNFWIFFYKKEKPKSVYLLKQNIESALLTLEIILSSLYCHNSTSNAEIFLTEHWKYFSKAL